MNTPKKVTLPTAVKQYSNIKSSPTHSTTGNFMEYACARCKELVKGQTYSFDMRTQVRLKPMQSPTQGRIEVHNRAFFVPFRLVMPGFNDFSNDAPYFSSGGNAVRVSHAHRIENSVFVNMFLRSDYSTAITADVSTVLANKAFDFVRYNSSNTAVPYKFTSLGRYAYKVLCQLGYKIYFNGPTTAPTTNQMYHSALPLLCFLRPYFDWYFPSMYADDGRANLLRKWFNVEPLTSTSFGISANVLASIFVEVRRVSYDTDYFTAAWDNPIAPTSGSYSNVSFIDPSFSPDTASRVGTAANGTPYVTGAGTFSQHTIDFLKSVTDFMRRNQISGARTLDRFIARWGSAPMSEKLLRSQYISEYKSLIRIGDVTATADSGDMPLGSYAGKGYGLSEKEGFVNYTADEAGMLIVISTIVPEPVYYQGALRHTMHLNMLDFYTPEFDNKGVQALSTREVYVPTGELATSDVTTPINFNNAVFGFVPRYAEYKAEPSQITGDLTLGSLNTGMEGWTLGRDLSYYFDGEPYTSVSHSQEFVDGTDADQYNRIFDVFSDEEDKFIIEHQFYINNRFPGAPLYDGYEFDSAGKAPNVTMDVNGVRAN